ncbi:MAG: DUF2357 domain-containing protein [Clostridia bacterium]
MNEDREKYNKYISRINSMLASDAFYATFCKKLKAAKPIVKLNTKVRNKVFDLEWVNIIEDTLPNLDNIVRNPRKFIVIEEDIVDISLARAISTESVKHLAQHTNLISSVDKDGMVTPNKILNTTKEESFEIYENRFIYTLIKNLSAFITRRMDAIKAAYVNDHVLELNVDTSLFTGKTRVFYKLELIASLPIDEVKAMDNEEMTVIERIAKMQRIVSDFLGSPFAKQMVNSAAVRPPITRTNVILKNTDFKRALVLWQFVESYSKMGFNVENDVKAVPIDEQLGVGITDTICMGTLLMEGLVEGNVEDKGFFSESNIDEIDKAQAEKEQAEKEQAENAKKEQVDKEQAENAEKEAEQEQNASDEQVTEETGGNEGDEGGKEKEQTGGAEEGDQPDSPTENKEDEESDDDVDLPDNTEVLAETRNLFQRTDEDTTLSKAEIARINKAIDRVLVDFRLKATQNETKEMTDRAQIEQLDKDVLIKQLRKEMDAIRRSIDKKTAIIEKERVVLEKSVEKEKERMNKLEDEISKVLEGKLDEINAEMKAKAEATADNDDNAEDIDNLEAESEKRILELENIRDDDESDEKEKETADKESETADKESETAEKVEEKSTETADGKAEKVEEKTENKVEEKVAKTATKKTAKKPIEKKIDTVEQSAETTDNKDKAEQPADKVAKTATKKTAKKPIEKKIETVEQPADTAEQPAETAEKTADTTEKTAEPKE